MNIKSLILSTLAAGVLALSLFGCASVPAPINNGAGPKVVGTPVGTVGSVAINTNIPVTMPVDVNPGEMLHVVIEGSDDSSSSTPVIAAGTSTVAGWNVYKGGATALIAALKIADGTESGTTVNFPFTVAAGSGPTRYIATATRISGIDTASVPAFLAGSLTNTKTPDPPSLTSGFGTVPTLWMSFVRNAGFSTSATTAWTPSSGYTQQFTYAQKPGTLNFDMSFAFKNTSLATEDPGAWSLTNANAPPETPYTFAFKGRP